MTNLMLGVWEPTFKSGLTRSITAPGGDPLDFEILGSVAGQLQHFGGQVLQNGGAENLEIRKIDNYIYLSFRSHTNWGFLSNLILAIFIPVNGSSSADASMRSGALLEESVDSADRELQARARRARDHLQTCCLHLFSLNFTIFHQPLKVYLEIIFSFKFSLEWFSEDFDSFLNRNKLLRAIPEILNCRPSPLTLDLALPESLPALPLPPPAISAHCLFADERGKTRQAEENV